MSLQIRVKDTVQIRVKDAVQIRVKDAVGEWLAVPQT